ncbi:WAS/WASL-interacting protein family member 1-like isoform X2 [Acanthaster planci]|uniref:WAS/WASL-interacting protein family member 1-like isoform X2 n=1 Tax=Acanthaster planci TaxID=133434 RepID=A0A8B7ZPC7_ACAPL|nr:WAS/WASL-interacting protein family member 1-like isoform X2 [Acanthaster planci]
MAAKLSVSLLCFAVIAITVQPPVVDSLPFSLDNEHPNARRVYGAVSLEDDSSEVVVQTFGWAQGGAGSSSEEEGGLGSVGSSSSVGGSAGGGPPGPPVVDPNPGQGTDLTPGPDTPGGGGGPETEAPSPPPSPQSATMPPVLPPTTPRRGDGGFGGSIPRRAGEQPDNAGRRLIPNPVRPLPPPKINNNIAAMSEDKEKPILRNRLGVPLGALLTVVVIGGIVVVLAVGGVAYFVSTRVRIS